MNEWIFLLMSHGLQIIIMIQFLISYIWLTPSPHGLISDNDYTDLYTKSGAKENEIKYINDNNHRILVKTNKIRVKLY